MRAKTIYVVKHQKKRGRNCVHKIYSSPPVSVAAVHCTFSKVAILLILHVVQVAKFRHTFTNRKNPDGTALNEPSHQDFHCLLS